MRRRRGLTGMKISLFPFLSVLCSIIGVLMLVITCIALGQIEAGASSKAGEELRAARERAKEHAALGKEAEKVLQAAAQHTEEQGRQLKQKLNVPLAAIQIQPRGKGVDRKPIFIEAAADRLIIHPSKQVERQEIPAPVIQDSKALGKLLDRAREEKDRVTVVFLIRPEGVMTFLLAELEAKKRDVKVGKLPVPGDGPIDLSLFGDI
jgi:hypothetical protein